MEGSWARGAQAASAGLANRMNKLEVLRHYFGYGEFREGQEEMIDALLSGRDVLGIMPTGAGKSVCYQVPALLRDGVALVVSPLISLMKDQVAALKAAGIPAAYINSSLTPGQQREALRRAGEGWYQVVYVAPERLDVPEFAAFAKRVTLSLIAVDEAHCVSQWGQDFRPSYLKIADFIDRLPNRPPVGAFTATATPHVKADIARLLRLREPLIRVTGFDRPNLRLRCQKPADKFTALRAFLQRHEGESGIVYCSTRKTVEDVCQRLQDEGITATRYHAGLEDAERVQNQDAFQFDRAAVMVATNAFGMGIDKSNVSFVLHYNMPKSVEAYYQEAGRAGRDGSPAECMLLYSGQDVITARWMLEHSEPNPELTADEQEALYRRDMERLQQMTQYCTAQRCLRHYLMAYFGEASQEPCDNCSVCLKEPFETVEERPTAQRVSRGRLADSPLHALFDDALYDALRQERLRLASERGIPAYVVFTDATLRDMTLRRPHTWDDFVRVDGVGDSKRDKYGDAFLTLLCRFDGYDYEPHTPPAAGGWDHAGRAWSSQEDERLRDEFDRDVAMGDLCAAHGRSAYAIRARLRKLGLTE